MSSRNVTLGGVDYPLGKFTIGDVVQLVPQLKATGDLATMGQLQAQASLVHRGIKIGGYSGSIDDFYLLENVTQPELDAAQVEIGRAIGHYEEKDSPKAGEAKGTESP